MTHNVATTIYTIEAMRKLVRGQREDGIFAGTVNEGTVTFILKHGGAVIGTATTSGTVSNGQASVYYVLPAGRDAGSYTVVADYSDSAGNFLPGNGQASQQIDAHASGS